MSLKIVVIISNVFLGACNFKLENTSSDLANKNLQAMHGITRCFDTSNFTNLGDYVATDCIDHSGDKGDLKGLDQMKAEFEKWMTMTDYGKTEVIREFADEEFVISWLRFEGTMKTEDMNMEPGDKFEKTSIEVTKFREGKAIEHWTFIEPAEMLKVMPGMDLEEPANLNPNK